MYNILRAQTAIHLKETKNGTKIFLWKYTEKYRHLLSKCFKNGVLWCQEMVFVNRNMFAPNRNMFAGKFIKWKRLFSMSLTLRSRFIKWMRFFEQNCIVKWVIFSLGFVRKNSHHAYWNLQTNIKKLYARNNILLKEFQIWDFESL